MWFYFFCDQLCCKQNSPLCKQSNKIILFCLESMILVVQWRSHLNPDKSTKCDLTLQMNEYINAFWWKTVYESSFVIVKTFSPKPSIFRFDYHVWKDAHKKKLERNSCIRKLNLNQFNDMLEYKSLVKARKSSKLMLITINQLCV